MVFKFNRKIHKSVSDLATVEVIEVDGVRSLYLGSVTIQSSMRVRTPYSLELPYSRGMMCFLLFTHSAKHVLSIGLGGGSVPKYIHQFYPEIKQTVVEINPQIIGIRYGVGIVFPFPGILCFVLRNTIFGAVNNLIINFVFVLY